MNKEKIIKLIYLIICILLLFFIFIYPIPPHSKFGFYLEKISICRVHITSKQIEEDVEKMRLNLHKLVCPGKEIWINVSSQNYRYYFGSIVFLFFITLNFIAWHTRKYAVCLVFYLNKGLKNIFKKI
jgi:hypothetical protein